MRWKRYWSTNEFFDIDSLDREMMRMKYPPHLNPTVHMALCSCCCCPCCEAVDEEDGSGGGGREDLMDAMRPLRSLGMRTARMPCARMTARFTLVERCGEYTERSNGSTRDSSDAMAHLTSYKKNS